MKQATILALLTFIIGCGSLPSHGTRAYQLSASGIMMVTMDVTQLCYVNCTQPGYSLKLGMFKTSEMPQDSALLTIAIHAEKPDPSKAFSKMVIDAATLGMIYSNGFKFMFERKNVSLIIDGEETILIFQDLVHSHDGFSIPVKVIEKMLDANTVNIRLNFQNNEHLSANISDWEEIQDFLDKVREVFPDKANLGTPWVRTFPLR